jgi:hypothetical protein
MHCQDGNCHDSRRDQESIPRAVQLPARPYQIESTVRHLAIALFRPRDGFGAATSYALFPPQFGNILGSHATRRATKMRDHIVGDCRKFGIRITCGEGRNVNALAFDLIVCAPQHDLRHGHRRHIDGSSHRCLRRCGGRGRPALLWTRSAGAGQRDLHRRAVDFVIACLRRNRCGTQQWQVGGGVKIKRNHSARFGSKLSLM